MNGSAPGRNPDPARIRVLVVDTDPVAARAHALYVRQLTDFEVVGIARTCAEARRQLGCTRVDLLLLDLHLPDGHGLTLARALRAAGHRADVIAVSSESDLAMVRESVSLGVVQYVLKPFTFHNLRDRLLRYAEFRAASGEANGQEEVDQVFAALRGPQQAEPPKGLSAPTLERVRHTLQTASDEGLSAAALGSGIGISRITARRYLEYLVGTGMAQRNPRYGRVGRPELNYRWVSDVGRSRAGTGRHCPGCTRCG
ncbi:response regulator [Streptomyces sp. NPDC020681]|uniref:response regulator n=1 Tax=Streptomyces sp. NPDC020681 TaxID=3365083 RepID=UPI0037B0F35E